MKICPKCGNKKFNVTAHVTQGWLVDERGEFLECTEECDMVTHSPDDSDIWTCSRCGYYAVGSEFEGNAYLKVSTFAMTTDKFDEIIKDLFGNEAMVEFRLEGFAVCKETDGKEYEDISFENVTEKLKSYFGVKSISAVFCDDIDTDMVYVAYEDSKPKNIKQNALKKCIFMSFNEFNRLVKNVLGSQYVATYDCEGVDVEVDPELEDIYSDPDHDYVLESLSNYFGVTVTSYHADDCDCVGVWICYK